MWEELGKFFIGASGVTGLILYLGRNFIDKHFDRSLEQYKIELEKLRFEHDVKFSRLHDKQAEVIESLYEKLDAVEKSMGMFVSPIEVVVSPSREEKGKNAKDDFNVFVNYYRQKEIYFSDEISKLLNEIIKKTHESWYQYVVFLKYEDKDLRFLPAPKRDELVKVNFERFEKAWEGINKDLPILKHKLKSKFQVLLGVENEIIY